MLCLLKVSRIGKKTIQLNNVEFKVLENSPVGVKTVVVKGPKGELEYPFKDVVNFKNENGEIIVERKNDSKESRSFHGLYRTLLNNMVVGVVEGYHKDLEIVGIGYRAEMQGANLIMSVGYSHKINYEPPKGITIKVTDQVNIRVEGMDKQLVGEVAAKIRAFRKPEPYKGKGVRYKGERVRKKSTKGSTK